MLKIWCVFKVKSPTIYLLPPLYFTSPSSTYVIMSQYPISVHLPFPSEVSSPSIPERPTSVSTTSTIGTPLSPNPYPSPRLTGQLKTSSTGEVTTPVFPAVLDSNLHLSARKIIAEFQRRDIAFARLIVGILAQRIELGILSPTNGIGFPFTDNDIRKVASPFLLVLLRLSIEIMSAFWMGFRIGI